MQMDKNNFFEFRFNLMFLHSLMPHQPGNTNRNGMSNSNWRLSERNMLFFAIPMLWKKLPVTIWKPMNGAMI